MTASESERRPPYSPDRRTALVLTGTGTDGAYHAGSIRALTEAGVRLDLIAGRGVGAVGAVFGAIDGGTRLWEPTGLWRRPLVNGLYPWRAAYRNVARGLAIAALLLTIPPLVLGLAAAVYQVAILSEIGGAGTAQWLTQTWGQVLASMFAPTALPTRLPQLVAAVLAIVIVSLLVAAVRARRRLPARRDQRGGAWWTLLATPMAAETTAQFFIGGLWDLLRGGANVRRPSSADLSRRYAELLAENLGQPGFRELLLVAHDVDARHDVVFALLEPEARRTFFSRKPAPALERRSSEAVDLAGASRDVLLDALAGALAIPGVTDAPFIGFARESYWRGETHRLSDRPASLLRLLEEVAHAGARQVIVVTAAAGDAGPHELTTRRVHPRARLGEYLSSAEAASVRDAIRTAAPWFDQLFVIRPAHNPVSALDSGGAYDGQSDRWQTVGELVDRGYEDAYRQFIDPVVGASGDELVAKPGSDAVKRIPTP
jgi:hypothetical protein